MSLLNSKNIVILGIIAFLVMSFWSLYSMPVDMNGKMVNCPFMNGSTSLCQMNLGEHISQWQQLFTVTREKNLLLSLFFLLAVSLVSSFHINTRVYDRLKSQRFRNYSYQHKPEIKLFDYIVVLFSKGILNPRIYA